jgi:ACR3 family arsenite transporter
MEKKKNTGIGFFEKYLTIWVILCMAAGILIGKFIPGIPYFLGA